MPNRILKESICTSPEINLLTAEEENLFYRLIVNCDDFGCMDARPAIIKAKCYPLQADAIKPERLLGRLRRLAEIGLVVVYIAGGLPYLKLSSWEDHQQIRAKKPKHPLPDDTCTIMQASDITCNQMISTASKCPRNPIQSNPIRNPIQSESNPSKGSEHYVNNGSFDVFWKHYPRKVSKKKAQDAWNKLTVTPELLTTMLKSIDKSKSSPQWRDAGGKYIPHPATWLNQERWTDEPSVTYRGIPGNEPAGGAEFIEDIWSQEGDPHDTSE